MTRAQIKLSSLFFSFFLEVGHKMWGTSFPKVDPLQLPRVTLSTFVWQPCIADNFSKKSASRSSLLTSRPSRQPRNGSSLNPILIGFQSWMTSLMLATSCLKGDVICECDLIIVKLSCFMSFWAQPLLNFLNDTVWDIPIKIWLKFTFRIITL